MAKEYKTLLGNRVYIEIDLPKYTLEMEESVKKRLVAEAAKKMNRAKVYDVGNGVPEGFELKKGEEVLVGKEGIIRGDFINLSEDRTVLVISPFDIIHIW